jgi:hypothetical protein
MDTRRDSSTQTAENPAAVADAESNALQMIAGLRERAARARAADGLPLAAAGAALALLGGWLILRRRGRR